jgi:16S rRNA (guanine966-N2)-methyltransferase
MRIIAGRLRGREIRLAKNSRIRPATGFVREMAMSLYTPDRLAAGGFLDICAGTGLVGFEALSRGAQHTYCIEVDAQTAAAIKDNAERFGVAREVSVLRCDARRCMGRVVKLLQGHDRRLSAAFLDAPYILGMAQDILERIDFALTDGDFRPAFTDEALLIARTPDKLRTDRFHSLSLVDSRESGQGRLWLFELAAPATAITEAAPETPGD